MAEKWTDQRESIQRYTKLIERHAGKAVRPYRADGYMNLLNKYGTKSDATEHYKFYAEPQIADETLTRFYEGNGLFSKIIDAPAEEAIKHGFEIDKMNDQALIDFYTDALDELDWEEVFMQSLKWMRLFGGAIAVMLINDGHGLEDPLDWKHIKSIDDIVVYERPLITPDWGSMFSYDPRDPFSTRGSRLGMPEYYTVSSRNGIFTVHESRCLIFQNGKLPENTASSEYMLWGTPEYLRIHRAIRDAEVAHGSAAKLLDRAVQAIYKMKNLSAELATDQGEDNVLRRLQTIDLARGLIGTMIIDAEGEDFGFQTFQFAGVPDVIDATCNFLSALTSIPQTILFGRAPAGMNSTGESDLENWYSFVERIQKRAVRSNLRYLLTVLFQAGVATGEVDEVPSIKVKFNPLWSLSEAEETDLEQKKAQIQLTRAQTAQTYVDMQAIDPSEVRSKLADSEEFDVENMLDEIDEDELYETYQEMQGGSEEPQEAEAAAESNLQDRLVKGPDRTPVEPDNGNSPEAAPAATKLPQDMTEEEVEEAEEAQEEEKNDSADRPLRTDSAWDEWLEDHLEDFSSEQEQMAFAKKVRNLESVAEINAVWSVSRNDMKETNDAWAAADQDNTDGGPGSGNFGHEGRPGEVGGSAAGSGGLSTHSSPVGCLFTDVDLEVWKKTSDSHAMNIQTGEVLPLDELDEYEPAAVSYEGEDVNKYGIVARSDMNRIKWEMIEEDVRKRGYSDLTDGDVFRMVSAVNHYGLGGDCQAMLYSQAPEIYSDIPNYYSKEDLDSFAKECEAVEEFIERSPKVSHPLYRGMTFNDSFDVGLKEKIIPNLRVGEELSFGHISSWSSSVGVADDYATRVLDQEFEEGQNYGVIYAVKNPKSGVSLTGINPQGECITSQKTRFKITNVKQLTDDDDIIMYHVELEEI